MIPRAATSLSTAQIIQRDTAESTTLCREAAATISSSCLPCGYSDAFRRMCRREEEPVPGEARVPSCATSPIPVLDGCEEVPQAPNRTTTCAILSASDVFR